jgi:hypothetical protein
MSLRYYQVLFGAFSEKAAWYPERKLLKEHKKSQGKKTLTLL